MVKRVETLTPEQTARMAAHADRWIGSGLRTGGADRTGFEAAARRCYEHAGLHWHGRVIWTSSPLVLALAGPIATLQIHLLGGDSRAEDAPVNKDVLKEAGKAVGSAVKRAVGEEAQRAVGRGVHWVVSGAVDPVGEAVREAISLALFRAIYGASGDSRHGTLNEAVGEVVARAVEGPLRQTMLRAVREAVASAVAAGGDPGGERMVRKVVSAVIRNSWPREEPGGWRWGADVTSFFLSVCGLELDDRLTEKALAYEQAVLSAHRWYADRDFVMACERPAVIHREAVRRSAGPRSHRLHRSDGPAVAWPDGWGVYSVHGRSIPCWIFEHPERITVAEIERESNAELRRVMIERYGWARFIRDCRAEIIDTVPSDHEIAGLRGARLLRKVLPGEVEPIVYLEMCNSTPEPDGTYRRYLERIDPKAYSGAAGRLCHAAMASRWLYRDERGELRRTFERWQDYRPTVES